MINLNYNLIFKKHITMALLTVIFMFKLIILVNADAQLQQQMQKLKISPDIIHIPNYIETIKIETLNNNNVIKPGDPLAARGFKDLNLSKITWNVNNYEARHTLLLVDLDRKPSPASGAGPLNNNTLSNIYNQFTSLNIPGNVISAGQNIVAFEVPVVPCLPSSKHRLLMLAFHQDQNIDIQDVAYIAASSGHSSRRENFKLQDFINRHRLELVAANVILAHGESVGTCTGGSNGIYLRTTTTFTFQYLSTILLIAMVMAISNKSKLIN